MLLLLLTVRVMMRLMLLAINGRHGRQSDNAAGRYCVVVWQRGGDMARGSSSDSDVRSLLCCVRSGACMGRDEGTGLYM